MYFPSKKHPFSEVLLVHLIHDISFQLVYYTKIAELFIQPGVYQPRRDIDNENYQQNRKNNPQNAQQRTVLFVLMCINDSYD
jgi:hypothetical protein